MKDKRDLPMERMIRQLRREHYCSEQKLLEILVIQEFQRRRDVDHFRRENAEIRRGLGLAD